jgi:hypothetical protein
MPRSRSRARVLRSAPRNGQKFIALDYEFSPRLAALIAAAERGNKSLNSTEGARSGNRDALSTSHSVAGSPSGCDHQSDV